MTTSAALGNLVRQLRLTSYRLLVPRRWRLTNPTSYRIFRWWDTVDWPSPSVATMAPTDIGPALQASRLRMRMRVGSDSAWNQCAYTWAVSLSIVVLSVSIVDRRYAMKWWRSSLAGRSLCTWFGSLLAPLLAALRCSLAVAFAESLDRRGEPMHRAGVGRPEGVGRRSGGAGPGGGVGGTDGLGHGGVELGRLPGDPRVHRDRRREHRRVGGQVDRRLPSWLRHAHLGKPGRGGHGELGVSYRCSGPLGGG